MPEYHHFAEGLGEMSDMTNSLKHEEGVSDVIIIPCRDQQARGITLATPAIAGAGNTIGSDHDG